MRKKKINNEIERTWASMPEDEQKVVTSLYKSHEAAYDKGVRDGEANALLKTAGTLLIGGIIFYTIDEYGSRVGTKLMKGVDTIKSKIKSKFFRKKDEDIIDDDDIID